jgi:hypothetical protein
LLMWTALIDWTFRFIIALGGLYRKLQPTTSQCSLGSPYFSISSCDGIGPASNMHHNQALLSWNPFADSHESSGQSTARAASTTFDHRQKPRDARTLRRRASGSDRSISTKANTYADDDALHPLRSAAFNTSFNVGSVTRPHLARMLDVGTLVDAPPLEPDSNLDVHGEHKDVLVHTVCRTFITPSPNHQIIPTQVIPGDSLAGISLKYGISLTNLRRANQLWASDSIHLRTVLYIPLNQASRFKKMPANSQLTLDLASEQPPDGPESSNTMTTSQVSSDVIQRVPASQLSFFPPPSTKAAMPIPSQDPPSSTPHHVRSSSYPSQSLTSLLNTLPIAPSTRDTFISRLSFDGTSSSYSDRESETSEDLELDDVKHAPRTAKLIDADLDIPTPVTPKAIPKVVRRASLSSSVHSHTSTNPRHISSSPQSYIPPHPQIRTVQLEPSPIMQIPAKISRTDTKGKGRGRGGAIDPGYELYNTGSKA